jgi:hypothetical protein
VIVFIRCNKTIEFLQNGMMGGRFILLTIFLLLWYQQYNSSVMKTAKTEAKHQKEKDLPKFVWIATEIPLCMQLPCPSICLVSSGCYSDDDRSRGNTATRMCGIRSSHLIGGPSAHNREFAWQGTYKGFCTACGIIHMTLQHHSLSVDFRIISDMIVVFIVYREEKYVKTNQG